MDTLDARKVEARKAQTNSDRPTVLVVDHYKFGQKTAVLQLNYLGFAAPVVTSCRQAVKAISKQSFEMILIGWGMPGCDGHSLLKYVRKLDDMRNTHTPVIGVSIHSQPGERERCILSGLDGLLSKPITTAQIQDVLNCHTLNCHTNNAA